METINTETGFGPVDEPNESHDFLQAVMNSTPLAVFIVQHGRVQFANKQLQSWTGYTEQELLGKDALWLVPPDERQAVRAAALQVLEGKSQQPYEYRLVTRFGENRWVLGSVAAIEFRGERAIMGNFVDITVRKLLEQQLQRQAFYDALTGLPNRVLFTDRLEHALEVARRRREPVALLFLDLDGFKAVNDRFGHLKGDEVLAAVASRLAGLVRREDTLARIGGDEFTVLLEGAHAENDVLHVAERVVEEMRKPFELWGESLRLAVSVGLALSGPEGTEASELLQQADIALYRAKAVGKSRVILFQEGMTLEAA